MHLVTDAKLGIPDPHILAFLRHAAQHSPYYREFDWAKNLLAGLPIRLHDIPVTDKIDLRKNTSAFRSDFDPPALGRVMTKYTSGSTGTQTEISKNEFHYAVNARENARLIAGWRLDDHKVSVIKEPPSKDFATGTTAIRHLRSGRVVHRIYTNSIAELDQFIKLHQPSHVLTTPSMMSELLDKPLEFGFLRLAETTYEAVPPDFASKIARLDGCSHLDIYGAVETAMLATKCVVCGKYHLAKSSNHLEILTEDGRNAGEGELGRVVVTVFSNYAMPLIRYDLGDYARLTKLSPCTPGEISLVEIVGREIMMFITSDGKKVWPFIDAGTIERLGIKRYKLIQISPLDVEFHYQMREDGKTLSKDILQNVADLELSGNFNILPMLTDQFPRTQSGKYLMHERRM